jgi:CelD/BcsL family acetyltransferase involved in cellulose biosynthesis
VEATITHRRTPLRIRLVRPGELTGADWNHLLASPLNLDSPFLGPGFAAAVDLSRGGVHVAVVERGSDRAFFAFQRHALGVGAPLGAYGIAPHRSPLGISDHHGIVTSDLDMIDLGALLPACGLRCWSFDHLTVRADCFAPFRDGVRSSPLITIPPGGIVEWTDRQRASGSRLLTELARKRRRLEREIGDVRFAIHSDDPRDLDRLVAMKRSQYRRTDSPDRLRPGWVSRLLRTLQQTQTPEFAGRLSVLRVGDRIAAMHLGLRSTTTWHWWIPAYDPAFARHSPGQLLLWEMVRVSESEGIACIDLGAGDARYKDRFADDRTWLASGRVGRLPPPHELAIQTEALLRSQALRHQGVGDGLRAVRRVVRRVRGGQGERPVSGGTSTPGRG